MIFLKTMWRNWDDYQDEVLSIDIENKLIAMQKMIDANNIFSGICDAFINDEISDDEYYLYKDEHERAKKYYDNIMENVVFTY